MVVYPAGPKRMGRGFRMEHSALSHMLNNGFKAFFNNSEWRPRTCGTAALYPINR